MTGEGVQENPIMGFLPLGTSAPTALCPPAPGSGTPRGVVRPRRGPAARRQQVLNSNRVLLAAQDAPSRTGVTARQRRIPLMSTFVPRPESPASMREEAFRRLQEFTRERGLKKSRQRELILDRFLGLGGHVSADDLHGDVREADASIGRTTVYRALRLFCEAHIATSIDLKDGLTRFEPALSRGHHDHLVCVRCGRIDEFLSPEVEQRQEEIATEHGYRLVWHRHQLYGVCSQCQEDTGD